MSKHVNVRIRKNSKNYLVTYLKKKNKYTQLIRTLSESLKKMKKYRYSPYPTAYLEIFVNQFHQHLVRVQFLIDLQFRRSSMSDSHAAKDHSERSTVYFVHSKHRNISCDLDTIFFQWHVDLEFYKKINQKNSRKF